MTAAYTNIWRFRCFVSRCSCTHKHDRRIQAFSRFPGSQALLPYCILNFLLPSPLAHINCAYIRVICRPGVYGLSHTACESRCGYTHSAHTREYSKARMNGHCVQLAMFNRMCMRSEACILYLFRTVMGANRPRRNSISIPCSL